MEDKKYVFYTTEGNIVDKMKRNEIQDIHIGTSEVTGRRDLSYHGSSMYEDITKITDIETGKEYVHDWNRVESVSILSFDDHEDTMKSLIASQKAEIEKLQKMLEQKQKELNGLEKSQKKLEEIVQVKIYGKEAGISEKDQSKEKDTEVPTKDEQPAEKQEETKQDAGSSSRRLYAKFNSKQIKEHFDHPSKEDKDGNPLKMVNILIPSKEFRHFRFGTDSHGYDRDKIQAYWTSLKALVKKDQDKDGNEKKNGRRYIYLNSDIEKPVYKVRFETQQDDRGEFVEPDPVILNAKQLAQIYQEQYEIGKEKMQNRDPNKLLEEDKSNSQSKDVQQDAKSKGKKKSSPMLEK